jgi:D-alanyl-D-alanine carboxypeptidase
MLIMKNIFIIFILIPCCLSAQDAQLEKYIDSLMTSVDRRDMPASLLIIAKDGKPVIRKAYGMASLEMGVPASPDHLFTLASVNKQMIAVCILQLAQQGKLKLTDDIRRHLPAFNTHGKLITVEQLLTHTSGIYSANGPVRGKSDFFDMAAAYGMLSDQQFLTSVMQPPLLFEPGTDWSWNTWAYHVAVFIVEKVSAMPFNEYVRNYLFEPAGMINSFSKVDGNRLGLNGIKNLNTSFYYPDADGKWVWRDTRRLTPYFFYQRYSIVTCLDDLVKWDLALREGKLLPKEWLEKAWTAGRLKDGRSTNYGLGWVVSQQDGYQLLSHGGIGTNPIYVVHVPRERVYIAYTQFFGNFEQVETRVKNILSYLLPLTYPVPAKSD